MSVMAQNKVSGKFASLLLPVTIVTLLPGLMGLLSGCEPSDEKGEVWAQVDVHVERLLDEPIITEATHPSIGPNIQGPSLIRVPDWVGDPLGRYYLYFADHKGTYIRLA